MSQSTEPNTSDRRITVRLTLGQCWAVGVTLASLISGAFGIGWSVSSWISGGTVAQADAREANINVELGDLTSKYETLQTTHEKLKTKEAVLRLFHFYHLAKLDEVGAEYQVALTRSNLDHLIPYPRPVFPRTAFLPPDEADARHKALAEYERKVQEHYDSLDAEEKGNLDRARSRLADRESELRDAKATTHAKGEGFIALVANKDEQARHLGIVLANISKGGGGTGTITFAYDGTHVNIPNEFLPKYAP